MTTFTDEQLTAFLDGELPDVEMQKIADALDTDTLLVERLSTLEVDFEPIKEAFDQLLMEAPIDKFQAITETQHVVAPINQPAANDHSWIRYAAVACFAIVVGVGIGGYSFQTPIQAITWKGEVARYQKLYSKETLAPFVVSSDMAIQDINRVSEDLGLSLPSKQFLPESLSFKRAQTLVFNQKPLAQFMYQAEDGTPIAICVLKNDKQDQTISLATIQGLHAASWNHDGFAYIVIGDTASETIENIAKNFVATI